MAELVAVQVIAYGHVQGVFFRAFISRWARQLDLTGYVRNLPTVEAVEVNAEGERDKLEQLIEHLKLGPPAARVDRVGTRWSKYSGNYTSFNIRY